MTKTGMGRRVQRYAKVVHPAANRCLRASCLRGQNRIINELPVNCAHLSFGCIWTGILRTLPDHLETCEFRPLPCPKADKGCDFSGPQSTHEEHVQRDCPFATVSCPRNCERFSGTRSDLKAHEDECDAFECEMPGCPTVTTKRQLPIHQHACAEYNKAYKKAMRTIRRLKDKLARASDPNASSRPVQEITLDDNTDSPTPSLKRNAEVQIKTESPLKRSRVDGPDGDDDEQMQGEAEESQAAQDAAEGGGALDDEEEELHPL